MYSKVGMNAMVTQFNENVFGEDAHEFRLERWLESEQRFRAMEKAMLVFGAGTRTCIGKHVSVADPGQTWCRIPAFKCRDV
jgi:cytochrome P450